MRRLAGPRRHQRVLDGAVATCREVGHDHHVPLIYGRHVECSGIAGQQLMARREIGPDHDVRLIELSGHQPALVAPLCQAPAVSSRHTGQC